MCSSDLVVESLASLPFYNLTTAELISDLIYTSITVKESYCQNPNFYHDICSTSNNSALQELQFRYSTDDEFNDLVKKTASSLELINISSLNKNRTRLIHFLQSLDTFDVIVLSEIWNYNLDFHHNIFSDYREYLQKLVALAFMSKTVFLAHNCTTYILSLILTIW